MNSRSKKKTVTASFTEKELCGMIGCRKVLTAKWIGTKGNRKMVVYGEM